MENLIFIAGTGKLANSIYRQLPVYLNNYYLDFWDNSAKYKQTAKVIIHVGSGRQLADLKDYCQKNKTPLIQASTGIKDETKNYSFTFIEAPNLSLLMLKFMYILRKNAELFKDYDITISESHQSSKKSVAGTAFEIAELLGVSTSSIESIREPEFQRKHLNIPEDFLSLHAYHHIKIKEQGSRIDFKTLIQGHDAYVKGLSKIIQCLGDLENRYYHILDLIEMKLI